MGFQGLSNETGGELPEAIKSDGIGAGNNEGKSPAFPAAILDHGDEGGEEESGEAGAVDGPGRAPETFDDWTDSRQFYRFSEEKTGDAGDDEKFYFFNQGAIAAEEVSRHEPEDHGGDGRDEIKRGVAAGVEDKWRGAGKEIEKPDVEGGGGVEILFPVSRETAEMIPVGRHADAFPIEAGRWQRVEGEEEADSEEDEEGGDPLRAGPGEGDEEEEWISESDLGEDIGKSPIGLFAPGGGEENGEEHKGDRPPEGMPEHDSDGLSASAPVGDRPRESHSHHEHEGRLNKIP